MDYASESFIRPRAAESTFLPSSSCGKLHHGLQEKLEQLCCTYVGASGGDGHFLSIRIRSLQLTFVGRTTFCALRMQWLDCANGNRPGHALQCCWVLLTRAKPLMWWAERDAISAHDKVLGVAEHWPRNKHPSLPAEGLSESMYKQIMLHQWCSSDDVSLVAVPFGSLASHRLLSR